MIKFRPHHFLCSVAYQGMGYSAGFIANFDRIAHVIRNDENTEIEVVFGLDDICAPCPQNNQKAKRCNDDAKIQKLDRAHATILNLRDRDVLTFKEAKKRIKEQMSIEGFHAACAPCEWKNLGVCEQAIKAL